MRFAVFRECKNNNIIPYKIQSPKLRMVMKPKYLAFRRWWYTPNHPLTFGHWIPRHCYIIIWHQWFPRPEILASGSVIICEDGGREKGPEWERRIALFFGRFCEDTYLDPPSMSNFSPQVCFWWLRGSNFRPLENSGWICYCRLYCLLVKWV